MGPDKYQDEPRGANVGAQLREETPVSKGISALEKSTDYLFDVLGRHTNKLRPVLSPQGTEASGVEGKAPQPPYSDLALALNDRAQAIYALAHQLEELTSRVEL